MCYTYQQGQGRKKDFRPLLKCKYEFMKRGDVCNDKN